MRTSRPGAFVVPDHNHRRCVEEALDAAVEVCRRRGLRLTEGRRRILELVWAQHRPVGAYELLEQLRRAGERPAPPTVYRALAFLVAQGLVHRIESLNAFVGCPAPGRPHRGQFLICRDCGDAAELQDARVDGLIRRRAAGAGFEVERTTVEALGLCPRCRGDGGG